MKTGSESVQISDANFEKACKTLGISIKSADVNPFLAKKSIAKIEKSITDDLGDKVEVKSLKTETLTKAQTQDLMKGLGLDVKMLIKAQNIVGEFSKFSKNYKALEATNVELVERNENLATEIAKLEKGLVGRISKIENTPMPRKSTTVDFAEKQSFQKGLKEGQIVLSLSGDKQQITNLLETKMEEEFAKGATSTPFGNAVMQYESDKILPSQIIKALQAENIYIVK